MYDLRSKCEKLQMALAQTPQQAHGDAWLDHASPCLLCCSQVTTHSTASGLVINTSALFTSPTRCVLCQWAMIIIRLYNMMYFMDKFAEFVFWTIPMLNETKTQIWGDLRILNIFCVPEARHFEVGANTCSCCQSYDLIRRFGRHC